MSFHSTIGELWRDHLYPRYLEAASEGLLSYILGLPLAIKVYLAMTLCLFLFGSRVTFIPFWVQINICSSLSKPLETSLALSSSPQSLVELGKRQMEDQVADGRSDFRHCRLRSDLCQLRGREGELAGMWTTPFCWPAALIWGFYTRNFFYGEEKQWYFFFEHMKGKEFNDYLKFKSVKHLSSHLWGGKNGCDLKDAWKGFPAQSHTDSGSVSAPWTVHSFLLINIT